METDAETAATLKQGDEAIGRWLFIGPGLFYFLLALNGMFWVLPFAQAPPWLGWALVAWIFALWPGINLALRHKRTADLFRAIGRVLGDIARLAARAFGNWLKERGILGGGVPRSQSPASGAVGPEIPESGNSAQPHFPRFAGFSGNRGKAQEIKAFAALPGFRIPSWAIVWLVTTALLCLGYPVVWIVAKSVGASEANHIHAIEAAKQAVRSERAQSGLNADTRARADTHEAVRAESEVIVIRAREEIDHAADLEALYSAHARGVGELREQAAAASSEAARDFAASLTN